MRYKFHRCVHINDLITHLTGEPDSTDPCYTSYSTYNIRLTNGNIIAMPQATFAIKMGNEYDVIQISGIMPRGHITSDSRLIIDGREIKKPHIYDLICAIAR